MNQNFIWGIVDKIALSATTFAPSLIVASFYSVAEYGEYFYSFSVAILISSISVLIDDKVLKKYYLTNHSQIILKKAANLRTISILFATILFYVIRFLLGYSTSSLLIGLFSINFIAISLSYAASVELQSKLQLFRLAIVNLFYSSFVIALFLTMSYLQFKLEVILTSWIFVSLIRGCTLGRLVRSNVKSDENQVKFKMVLSLAKESLPFGVAAIAFMLYSRMDALMIKYFLSAEDVAIYSFATQIIAISTMIIIPIQIAAFPILKQSFRDYDMYRKILTKYTRKGLFIYLFMFILLLTLFSYFAESIGPEYKESTRYLYVLFFSGLSAVLASLRSTHITLKGLGSFLLKLQILSLIINCALNLILIPRLGSMGAALATLAAQFVSLIFSNWMHKDLWDYAKIQYKSLNLLKLNE